MQQRKTAGGEDARARAESRHARRPRATRAGTLYAIVDHSLRPRIPRRKWSRRLLRHYPPPIPRGWRTGPPDFVGVGAQRSGSSWWFRFAVEAHPRVVRMEDQEKELHYFDRFWHGRIPADFVETYHRFFPRPQGAITGEWTPRYMFDFWSMRLLHQAAPEARILVILRDPIERFRSGFAMRRRWGLTRGRTLDAVAGAVARSAYADQLARVFAVYPREQVLVLQYERCRADQVTEMQRTLSFLGLDPVAPAEELVEKSRPPREKPSLSDEMQEDLVARLLPDVERLAELCPEIDISLWPSFRDLAPTPTQLRPAPRPSR